MNVLDFKLLPCSVFSVFPFGFFPGVWFIFCICVKWPLPPGDNPIAVNKYYYYYYIGRSFGTFSLFHLQGRSAMKLEQIECSETSANINQTPGKHPKENTLNTWMLHSWSSKWGTWCAIYKLRVAVQNSTLLNVSAWSVCACVRVCVHAYMYVYYYYLFLTEISLTPGGSSTVHIVLTPGGSSTVHIYTQTIHIIIHRTEHTQQ
jgi:hypothetical protein